jgi:GTP pyrophosphokinase
MVRKEDLRAQLIAAVPAKYQDNLQKAIDIADQYYSTTIRLSGERLFDHLLRSAKYYAELKIDYNGIVATLLHHELPKSAYKDKEVFTDDVMMLLDNLGVVFSHARKESVDTQVIYKYILSFADDLRITLIKLSEKFDNAKTIDLLSVDKRTEVANRLLSIYAPLAEYVNLSDAKNEFDLDGFRVAQPEEYSEIANFVHDKQKDIFIKIAEVKKLILDVLDIVGIDGQVWGRVKSYYSIWRKLRKLSSEGRVANMSNFNDLIAFTIMVDNADECYSIAYALKDYADVPDQYFEDYIRNPKPNGFSEIQLVCTFPELVSINVEIQILTKDMYWHNTYGPASHIAYKLAGKRFAKSNTEFQWIEMVHNEIEKRQSDDDLPLSKPMSLHLFQDKVFTFTPKHRVVELPLGATALDFAYQVHTLVGDQAVFAKINGETQSLSFVLKNGDVVEIITDPKKQYPTENWLEFTKTKNAISRIKHGLKKKKYA